MTDTNDTFRIYVACLAAYNNGILHGRWINAAQEPLEIAREIAAMLAQSPERFAEEWAIHDYDGLNGLGLGEYKPIAKIAAIACVLEEKGEAMRAFLSLDISYFDDFDTTPDADHDSNIAVLVDSFEEHFRGEWSSEEEFTEEQVCELGLAGVSGEACEGIASYIDWEYVARDIFFQHGNYSSVRTQDGNVWVFEDEV